MTSFWWEMFCIASHYKATKGPWPRNMYDADLIRTATAERESPTQKMVKNQGGILQLGAIFHMFAL